MFACWFIKKKSVFLSCSCRKYYFVCNKKAFLCILVLLFGFRYLKIQSAVQNASRVKYFYNNKIKCLVNTKFTSVPSTNFEVMLLQMCYTR